MAGRRSLQVAGHACQWNTGGVLHGCGATLREIPRMGAHSPTYAPQSALSLEPLGIVEILRHLRVARRVERAANLGLGEYSANAEKFLTASVAAEVQGACSMHDR